MSDSDITLFQEFLAWRQVQREEPRAYASKGMPPRAPTQGDEGDVGEGSKSASCSSDVSPPVVQMKESKTTTAPDEAEMAVQSSAVQINASKVSFNAEDYLATL